MIEFYYNLGPNPMKVALCLEEMGLPYLLKPVDTRKGEQHQIDYLAVNPNAKVPAIVDQDSGAVVFDSNAILLYLAEMTGQFLPSDNLVARGELLSWLMFVATGVGPFSGQAVHFKHYASEPIDYAVNRYTYEARRHFEILEARLAERRYVLGDTYTIVDMAVWGWGRLLPFILGDSAWADFTNLQRLLNEINARPAARAAIALKDRHAFRTETDEDARKYMFRHLAAQNS
jgi:GSH-dependent disulfide-bond oxidoreductase